MAGLNLLVDLYSIDNQVRCFPFQTKKNELEVLFFCTIVLLLKEPGDGEPGGSERSDGAGDAGSVVQELQI